MQAAAKSERVQAFEQAVANDPLADPTPRRLHPQPYDPDLCDEYELLAGRGWTVSMICAHWRIGWATIKGWAEAHSEFGEAVARGEAFHQAWYEGKIRGWIAVDNSKAPLGGTMQLMKAKFADYREQSTLNVNIQVEERRVLVDLRPGETRSAVSAEGSGNIPSNSKLLIGAREQTQGTDVVDATFEPVKPKRQAKAKGQVKGAVKPKAKGQTRRPSAKAGKESMGG